ncbi:HlyD family secretion protein [Parapedobacter tibetensis]|uniref:HlyD family secretion protein n=1 Tax=Parapedobacter tibetensis TaxID=2972951 RepID=UPI00214D5368|nr:HlyD family secretion protein [Parapedobacter tibetensis]
MDVKDKEPDTLPADRREVHTEDIQDIIGTPPHGLLRWGITWVLVVLLGIVALAAFIRYPDIVRAPVRINAANAPKAVISRISGNIVDILVEENAAVEAGQPLAWMESTADHGEVLELLERLHGLRDRQFGDGYGESTAVAPPINLQLGELQNSYQAFYQSYLTYRAAIGDGIYLKRRAYIQRDMQNVEQQRKQLELQRELQEREYTLAETEFERYRELAERKVISPSEYQQQQATLLAKQHPMQQTQSALLANEASHTAKAKELADLDNQIAEEKSKFMQALNSLISEAEQWKSQHVLTARQAGTVVYAGIIQRNQHIEVGQEVFHINPGSTDFFGEVNIPQYNMGKVEEGQEVLVKLNSFPFEEYGVLKGSVGRLSGVPYQDSIFLSRVDLQPIAPHRHIRLTTGMVGTAEIVTEDASLLQRLVRNIRLVLGRD